MKVVHATGTPREIGHTTGEALRDEIASNLEHNRFDPAHADWQRRYPVMQKACRGIMPTLWDEMEATAEGANQPIEAIAFLNFATQFGGELDFVDRCTNAAFATGTAGTVLGKNNDGWPPHQTPCIRIVEPNEGIPQLTITFAGMLAVADGINAEGVAVGHSSVGSVFQQRDDWAPIRMWYYYAMHHARSSVELFEWLSRQPLRGKGYAMVTADAQGNCFAIEAPCPLVQKRDGDDAFGHVNCTNYYQLPFLAEADRRDAAGKCNAIARREKLDALLANLPDPSVEDMFAILRHHDEPGNASICRHGNKDMPSLTEYAMVFVPEEGNVFYYHGQPCQGEFEKLSPF